MKTEAGAVTGGKEKLQSETKDQNNRNPKNKYSYYKRGRYVSTSGSNIATGNKDN